MRIRFVLFAALVVSALALPALADRTPPPLDPVALARAHFLARQTLDQTVRLTSRSAFSVDQGAHTAQLTGKGTASLDSGATIVGNAGAEVTVNVVFSNADDPALSQCREALAQNIPNRGPIKISGHGYFNLSVENGVLNKATVMLDVVTSCDPGGTR